jgi:hypothetical protein
VVALESAPGRAISRAREYAASWLLGALLVLGIGTLLRLLLGGLSVASLAAALLSALVWLGLWLVSLLLASGRAAFFVGLVAMIVLDVAGLPPRALVEYDDREVLYRTDQSVAAPLLAGAPTVYLLVEPVMASAQPRFGLAGELGTVRVEWSCPVRRGVQRLALPLPPGAPGASDLRLHLTGAPARDGDYLVVYKSAAAQGLVVSAPSPNDDVTSCELT